MLRIIACDDCKEDREWLKKQLKEYFLLSPLSYSLKFYESGDELLKYYEPYAYDLIFFDVEMPGENGVEVAKKLREVDGMINIIFLTSHKKYVFSSFLAEPIQYLLKPLEYDELCQVMKIVEKKLIKKKEEHYSITFNGNTNRIPLDKIMYFESQGRTISISTVDKSFQFYSSLNDVERKLNEKDFMRIHQSYLVNIKYISKLVSSSVLLNNGEELPISRSKKKLINERFMDYIGGLL